MRRIAERIGLSPMAAYKHFDSRDAILAELLREGFAELERAMLAEAADAPSPADALHALVDAYLAFAAEHRDLYLVMYGLGGVRVEAATTWGEGSAVGRVVADVLTRLGRPTAALDDDVLALWAAVHGLIALDVAGRLPGGDATLARLAHRHAAAALALAQRA